MKNLSLNEKLQLLYPTLEAKQGEVDASVGQFFNREAQFLVFLSATDGKDRARVAIAKANTFAESWQQAVQNLRKILFTSKVSPIWVKADLVTAIETVSIHQLLTELEKTKPNYFRRGIAFDPSFRNAFLEQEVNANGFFHHGADGHIEIMANSIHHYSKKYRNATFQLRNNQLTEVHLFDTKSVFCDESDIYEQHTGLFSNGTRMIGQMDKKVVENLLCHTTQFLLNYREENGKFHHANFPTAHKIAPTYNTLHHASAVYAMVEVYEITQDESLRVGIQKALDYLIEEAMIIKTIKRHECAFIVEKEEDEIKLGANAFTLLALLHYTTVTEETTYEPFIEPLANGILHCQKADGSFNHVLHLDGTVKDAFRTPYYDGETVLALMKLYEQDHNRKWLFSVERSFRHFIRNEYWQHGDPWLNRAATLLFKYRPKRAYANLNLQTTNRLLTNALINETASPMLVEVLMATHQLIVEMKKQHVELDLLEEFDEEKLKLAIEYRLKHQLNSYFWPEMAMYFAVPHHIVHSFYIRENTYFVQIDNVAAHVASYCHYYQVRDSLNPINEHQLKEAEMLTTARHYENQERLDKVIACFQTDAKNQTTWLDITYVHFAEALRLTGQLNEAKQVLGQANKTYPESESILIEFLNLCMSMDDYRSALIIAGDLIKLRPQEGRYYFELGRAYAKVNDHEKAMAAFKIGLIYHHNISTEQLIDKVQEVIPEEKESIASTYTFLGGMNNLGVLVHENAETNKKYITKITRTDSGAMRERLFYQQVLSENPALQEIIPSFIAVETMDQVQYLTLEMIDLVEKTIPLEQVIETSEKITAVPYIDVVDKYPNPTYDYAIKPNMGPPIVQFFTEIHQQSQNELLFQALKTYAIENKLMDHLANIIQRMEAAIMPHQLYNHLIPEVHYSLLHGDFTLSNMSVRDERDALVVLDWGSFVIGPRFIDMALMLTNLPISFQGIEGKYLLNEDKEKRFSLIEEIFFLYALILFMIIKLEEDNVEIIIEVFIVPALERMETTVEEFIKM